MGNWSVFLTLYAEAMPQTFIDARISHIIDETASVKRFFFEVLSAESYTFNAGQFVMLDLPIASKITNRSYSIASAPANNNTFELCIVLKSSGLGTTYMWEHFKPGHLVKISRPLGKICSAGKYRPRPFALDALEPALRPFMPCYRISITLQGLTKTYNWYSVTATSRIYYTEPNWRPFNNSCPALYLYTCTFARRRA